MFLHEEITDKIIGAFYQVNNTLGYGFLEIVYERAMIHELHKQGCRVETQKNIKVYYDEKEIGDYFADMVVNNCVIVELKAAESLCYEHEVQLINYLRATKIEVGLLLNFGKKAEFKRKLFMNSRKMSK
jgi:GxxExxY protein